LFFVVVVIFVLCRRRRRRRHRGRRLESEQEQEGHHETEETHGFGKGESQNGVGEKLLLERRVPGIADDERAEDGADSGAGPGDAHRRSTGPDVLGRRIDIQSTGRSLEGSGSDGVRRGESRVSVEQRRRRCRRRRGSIGTTGLRQRGRRRRRRSVTSQRRSGDWDDNVPRIGEHDCPFKKFVRWNHVKN